MPITAEQFDAVRLQKVEAAMRSVYNFLRDNPGFAYSIDELATELQISSRFMEDVLEELEFRGAVESRDLDSQVYYRRAGSLTL